MPSLFHQVPELPTQPCCQVGWLTKDSFNQLAFLFFAQANRHLIATIETIKKHGYLAILTPTSQSLESQPAASPFQQSKTISTKMHNPVLFDSNQTPLGMSPTQPGVL